MKSGIISLAILLAIASNLFAMDYSVKKNDIGLDGGVTDGIDGNDFEDSFHSGQVIGLHYTRYIRPDVGLGLQLDVIGLDDLTYYSGLYIDLGGGDYLNLYNFTELKMTDVSLMMTGRFNMVSKGMAIPYIMAGVGMNKFQVETSSNESIYSYIGGNGDFSSVSGKDTSSSVGLSTTMGLGLDMMISDVFQIGAEVRHNLYRQNALEGMDDLEMVLYKARLTWYF